MTTEIKLQKNQFKFLNSTRNSLFVAGYGAGKSYAGTIKTITKKLQCPKHKVAYYLPNFPLVRDIAFDKFPTILSDMGLKYRLNKSDKEIIIDGCGTIIFRSMDTPETIVGYEVAYSLIDEADILPRDKIDKAYKKILARNRAVPNANVDAVSTPEGFKWLYEMANSGHFEVIRASTYDNKYLPPDYIDTLKAQYPENLLKAYLNGEFVNLTSGSVYSYFNRDTHGTQEVIKEGDTLHIGADFNVGGCINIVCVERVKDDVVTTHAVDELISYDTYAMTQNLKNRYKGHQIIIYPDASGQNRKTSASETDIEILRNAGLLVYVNHSNPSIKDRVNIVNNLFEKRKLLINIQKCPELTKALEQQAWDNKTQLPEKSDTHPSNDDYNDSLGYAMAYKYPILPRNYKISVVGV
ncbi:phage terminase large subunit [Campylobacter sp. RM16191]|uniref:phage terminase large subunit n=1 Tax=Campylobacter sp. RM16191 TaxID=1705728 RepID=UPI001475F369|nr:phage terminase large subunit [Campylobacter sp. RM16191]